MIRKQINILITEKDEKYAEDMIKNDPDFASFPNLASMALKEYIRKYKEQEKDKEW